MPRTFWVETLGCPKNQVDSDKLTGTMLADGLVPAAAPEGADLVVVNTCAFIEEARQESVDVILGLAERKRAGAELVVTGCLAERYGSDLADALPEADAVAGFGVPVTLGPTRRPGAEALPAFDLLNLPRPAPSAPWAYVKVAEGCDRVCGFCAIPAFRGKQRSRSEASILAEVEGLAGAGVREVVLVAQDLASFGRDQGSGERRIVPLVEAVARQVDRVRLLYLYPSDLTDELTDAICATGVPYFDLSLQHASRPLLRRMRRWGDGKRFLRRIDDIRAQAPEAAFRSNFIIGYPGETEDDHDELLRFVAAAELGGKVDPWLAGERLAEVRELQDGITARRRDALVGSVVEVLVDAPGEARSHREAPEIDGIVAVPEHLAVGELAKVTVTGAAGTDLEAV